VDYYDCWNHSCNDETVRPIGAMFLVAGFID